MEIVRDLKGKVACKVDWENHLVEIKNGNMITVINMTSGDSDRIIRGMEN